MDLNLNARDLWMIWVGCSLVPECALQQSFQPEEAYVLGYKN